MKMYGSVKKARFEHLVCWKIAQKAIGCRVSKRNEKTRSTNRRLEGTLKALGGAISHLAGRKNANACARVHAVLFWPIKRVARDQCFEKLGLDTFPLLSRDCGSRNILQFVQWQKEKERERWTRLSVGKHEIIIISRRAKYVTKGERNIDVNADVKVVRAILKFVVR